MSSVAAARNAIEALFAAAVPDALVKRGQIGTYGPDDQLLIGETTGDEAPVTTGHPTTFREEYVTTCEAHTYGGDDDITAREARVLAMHAAVRVAVNTDPSLGLGAACHAYLSGYQLVSGYAENGTSAQLEFRIRITNAST